MNRWQADSQAQRLRARSEGAVRREQVERVTTPSACARSEVARAAGSDDRSAGKAVSVTRPARWRRTKWQCIGHSSHVLEAARTDGERTKWQRIR